MKRMLIVCLLGMGLLLPSTHSTAKELLMKKVVDVWIEIDILRASSDDYTGSLTMIRLFNGNGAKVGQQSCSGYSCSIYVGGLPAGEYSAQVTTTTTVYYENFVL